MPITNTRADLDAIAGTPEHTRFMTLLKGSMTRRVNTQTYPEGYGTPGYEGPALEPVWQVVPDHTLIAHYGFVATDFEGV